MSRTHLFIPDAQVKPGDNTDHLTALGEWIVDNKPDVIINIGDFADMASLSSYERAGSKYFEGKSYVKDIQAAKDAMDVLLNPMREYNNKQRRQKHAQYYPEMHMFMGNHENRIVRAINSDPVKLEGVMSLKDLEYEKDWIVHQFLEPCIIDGITYSHYFTNPIGLTGHPIGGSIDNKLQKLGQSFCMGHQQTMQYGEKYDIHGRAIIGLVSGAFYTHDESYLGPQKNRQHFRGFHVLHNVENGMYDLEQYSIKRLMQEYGNE